MTLEEMTPEQVEEASITNANFVGKIILEIQENVEENGQVSSKSIESILKADLVREKLLKEIFDTDIITLIKSVCIGLEVSTVTTETFNQYQWYALLAALVEIQREVADSNFDTPTDHIANCLEQAKGMNGYVIKKSIPGGYRDSIINAILYGIHTYGLNILKNKLISKLSQS